MTPSENLRDLLNEAYSSEASVDYSPYSRVVRFSFVMAHRPAQLDHYKVLDLGCGDGAFLRFALSWAFPITQYFGVEPRDKIALSAKKFLRPNQDFVVEDMQSVQEGEFDICLALGLVSYRLTRNVEADLATYRGVISDTLKKLSPSGLMFLTLRNSSGPEHRYLAPPLQQVAPNCSVLRRVNLFENETMFVLAPSLK